MNNFNPFKDNRTEQMKDLWQYYVPFSSLEETNKPIMVEGGRGSGKTMYFQCNSWRQTLQQIRMQDKDIGDLLNESKFIGIYYRVDTTFVSLMCDQEENDWNQIFQTYLCICILKEIIDFFIEISQSIHVDQLKVSTFASIYSKKINRDSKVESLQDFKLEADRCLDAVEDKINGLEIIEPQIRSLNANRFIGDICKDCNDILGRELCYKIFIDEYETLQEYQQRIINTLIKHSGLPVIYNIGLRPKGAKTFKTISETEIIESPHDFEIIQLGIKDQNKYPQMLKDICKKRIQMGKEQGKIPAYASEDIEFYLGQYSFENELARLAKSPSYPHIKKLRQTIKDFGKDENLTEKQIIEYTEVLCDNADVLHSRLHYALLCKKTYYTPTLQELYNAYTTKNKRYREWFHNRKFGIIFLLCKETKRGKQYNGFDVYSALSSYIVRYFLELCEQAFRIAYLSDFSWNKEINPETQTEAAKYVSEYKVGDIIGYEPYGRNLRIFIQYLGSIFYKLHTYELNTLGEPEPNHFSTDDLSISSDVDRFLSSAIMWNVLQEGEPTKRKNAGLSPETVDYYINKIYVPYFNISYRNQRKIKLNVGLVKQLFSGNEEQARSAFRTFFSAKGDQPNDFNDDVHQTTLFDVDQGVIL